MGLDITGLGSVADFADGILDRFFPKKMTEEERTVALAGIKDAAEKRDIARDSIKGEVMKAELSQGDNYTKRARPTVVYAGLGFIFLVHVFFPIIAWFNLVPGKEMPDLSLPSEFWVAWGGICSVWMVGRSAEKISPGNKITKIITGE